MKVQDYFISFSSLILLQARSRSAAAGQRSRSVGPREKDSIIISPNLDRSHHNSNISSNMERINHNSNGSPNIEINHDDGNPNDMVNHSSDSDGYHTIQNERPSRDRCIQDDRPSRTRCIQSSRPSRDNCVNTNDSSDGYQEVTRNDRHSRDRCVENSSISRTSNVHQSQRSKFQNRPEKKSLLSQLMENSNTKPVRDGVGGIQRKSVDNHTHIESVIPAGHDTADKPCDDHVPSPSGSTQSSHAETSDGQHRKPQEGKPRRSRLEMLKEMKLLNAKPSSEVAVKSCLSRSKRSRSVVFADQQ